MTDEERQRVRDLAATRNVYDQEITHRAITGRRYNRDFKEIDDDQLAREVQWYRDEIQKIVGQYE